MIKLALIVAIMAASVGGAHAWLAQAPAGGGSPKICEAIITMSTGASGSATIDGSAASSAIANLTCS